MTSPKRPLAINLIAGLYLAVGILGFAHNLSELLALQNDAIAAEITEVLAMVAGVGMFFGQNWARWLAVAWIAFHAYLSAFHAMGELAVHALFLVAIAWILFRPESGTFFRQNSRRNTKQTTV
jgi:hypothetical protein